MRPCCVLTSPHLLQHLLDCALVDGVVDDHLALEGGAGGGGVARLLAQLGEQVLVEVLGGVVLEQVELPAEGGAAQLARVQHLPPRAAQAQRGLERMDGYNNSQFHIAPHELKKIAQAKKSIPFYVIKRAKKIFFRFFHFLGCLWAPKNMYPRKKFKFFRGPPGAPPCEKKGLLKAKMSFFMP